MPCVDSLSRRPDVSGVAINILLPLTVFLLTTLWAGQVGQVTSAMPAQLEYAGSADPLLGAGPFPSRTSWSTWR